MADDGQAYEVAVVGGGPGGLTAALYTTRLGHDTVVVNRGGGRAAMMAETHNVIGITEDVSGMEFLQTAREQVKNYGADYVRGYVETVERRDDGRFHLHGGGNDFVAEKVVLATGFTDVQPDPPLPPTGRGLHYCVHCDAYMFVDESVYVMGVGEAAAQVAMILLNFTDDVDLLTRGEEPRWSDETDRQLRAHPVDVVHEEVVGIEKDDDGWLSGIEFEDGRFREYRGGFPMYGSDYNAELVEQLGCERNDDGTVVVDDAFETTVDGVYAVGDLTPGHKQIPVAMGEGANAGIDIHYDLRTFPKSLDEIDAAGDVTAGETPGLSESVREAAREFRASGDD
jgi:thioredoxin reductase (NADPH)